MGVTRRRGRSQPEFDRVRRCSEDALVGKTNGGDWLRVQFVSHDGYDALHLVSSRGAGDLGVWSREGRSAAVASG